MSILCRDQTIFDTDNLFLKVGSSAFAILGLGANLGKNPGATLQAAVHAIGLTSGICKLRAASLYSSAPVDAPGPHYTNTVVVVETTLSPLVLLDKMQEIEREFGRRRDLPTVRNAPRTLDIDLLWYDAVTIDTPRLILPHPRMHQRAFVLMPLQELVGDRFLIKGGSITDWLKKNRDQPCLRLIPDA